jgi:FkbM family methyltransferase
MRITSNDIAILDNDTHISRWVEQSGRLDHDQYALPIICEYISFGDTVIDAGAFIGDHTIAYLNAVGPKGIVYAFEPNPNAYECLAYNCKTAKTFNCGLSNTTQTVYYDTYENAGASRITKQTANTIKIKTITVDSLKLAKLNFLKIDVEGYELNVLNGAKKSIKKYRPKMWIEINKGALLEQGKTHKDIEKFLLDYNYSFTAFPEVGEQYDILCIPL